MWWRDFGIATTPLSKQTYIANQGDNNVSQYLGDLGCEHVVFKNDEKTVEEIAGMNPRGILVSPGPGTIHLPQPAFACVPRNSPGKQRFPPTTADEVCFRHIHGCVHINFTIADDGFISSRLRLCQ